MSRKKQTDAALPRLVSVLDGVSRPDIPYYLGSLFADVFRRKVLIIDNTEAHELYGCIGATDGMEIKEQSGLSFMQDVAYSRAFFERFDSVIVIHGKLPDRTLLSMSNFKLILTGYRPGTLSSLLHPQAWADEEDADAPVDVLQYLHEEDTSIFFLDKVTEKVSAQSILKSCSLNAGRQGGIPYVELPLDEKDQTCLLGLLYNGSQGSSGISRELSGALAGLASVSTGTPLSGLRKRR